MRAYAKSRRLTVAQTIANHRIEHILRHRIGAIELIPGNQLPKLLVPRGAQDGAEAVGEGHAVAVQREEADCEAGDFARESETVREPQGVGVVGVFVDKAAAGDCWGLHIARLGRVRRVEEVVVGAEEAESDVLEEFFEGGAHGGVVWGRVGDGGAGVGGELG